MKLKDNDDKIHSRSKANSKYLPKQLFPSSTLLWGWRFETPDTATQNSQNTFRNTDLHLPHRGSLEFLLILTYSAYDHIHSLLKECLEKFILSGIYKWTVHRWLISNLETTMKFITCNWNKDSRSITFITSKGFSRFLSLKKQNKQKIKQNKKNLPWR